MPQIATPWLDLARAELGVREAPGAADNTRVLDYYRDAGHPEIRHDAVAWCAAFACAMLERSGHPSPKTLSARDCLRWGKPVEKPQVGAVAVFTRGDPKGWQGHVGFVTGWDGTRIRIISGNVRDSVTEDWFPRSQLLGLRVPVTPSTSRTVIAASGSAASGLVGATAKAAEQVLPEPETILQMADAGNAFVGSLEAASALLPVVGFVASLLSIVLAAVTLWARLDDLNSKGR